MKLETKLPTEMLEPSVKPEPTRVLSQVLSASREIWAVEFSPLLPSRSQLGAEGGHRSRALAEDSVTAPERAGLSPGSQGRVMLVAHIVAMQVSEIGAARRTPLDGAPGSAPRRVTQEPLVIQMQALSEHDGNASLQLGHPELGSMVIEIELRHGGVEVRIVVGNTQALDTLRAGEQGLRANVAAHGVELKKLTINIARRQRKQKRRSQARQDRGQREEI